MGEFAAVPFVLLPYQQRWVDDPAPVKIAEKSRRIGLTWAEACDNVLEAARASGDDTWYVGYNQDMAREYIETCADWSRELGDVAKATGDPEEVVIDDDGKDIQAFRIRYPSGHKITALSSRPSNLRGKQGTVVIDEAAFHPELGELLKAAMALLMWGGKVRVISTHDGDTNPFNELIQDVRAGRKPYSLHRTDFDEALADGLFQRICLKQGIAWTPDGQRAWRQEIVDFYGSDADEELFCIPSKGGGTYLPGALVEARMTADAPVVRCEKPDSFAEQPEHIRHAEVRDWCEQVLAPLLEALDSNCSHVFGEDFGRSGDLSVIWPIAISRGLIRETPFLVELRNIPFKQQEQILFYIVDRLPRFRAGAMDARGNGQYLAEVAMQRYGSNRIAQVMLSIEWYRENMPRYKAAFEDSTITLPRDADVLSDHRALVMEKGVARLPEKGSRTKGTDGKQRHGDSAIAGALAYAASVQDVTEYDYTPAPKKRGRLDEVSDDRNDVRDGNLFGAQRGAY